MARVFVSHASKDRPLAGEVHQWLIDAGHEVFLDQDMRDGITLGEEWEQRLHERLRWANAVICVVTSAFLDSTWCAIEIGIARSQGSQLLPLCAEPGAVHPLLTSVHHVDYTADPPTARTAVIKALHQVDATWPDDRSPFPGLHWFDIDRHQVFFGRTVEVENLTKLLRSPAERAEGAALLVVGPSGCGKSSLVRAGLLPAMADEPGWRTLPPILPGSDPVAALARELTTMAQRSTLGWTLDHVHRRLNQRGLTALADELLLADPDGPHRRLLITVDQFEELLTQTTPTERTRFAGLLRPALTGPVRVVATLRPEFLNHLLVDPDMATLPTRTYTLRPLRRDALHTVIKRPAKLAGIDVDEHLVDRLVDDTDSGEALPLLAFTLAQLTDGVRRGGRLSSTRYDQLGGVQGALTHQADTALADAITAGGRNREQVIAGLLRLVTVDEEGRPTRWRINRAELPDVVVTELDAFVARRLLTTDTDNGNGNTVVGVAHEAFLSAWPPLADAITENESALRARRAVEQAAVDWDDNARPRKRLWGGGQLAGAVADIGIPISAGQVDLSPSARDFLHTSIRHDRFRRRSAIGVLSVLLILALVAAGVAVYQQRGAQEQQRIATARQLVTRADAIRETDPRTALLLGLAAESVRPGGETRASLVNTLTTTRYAGTLADHAGSVTAVAFAPDGRTLATGDSTGTVILRDLTDPDRTGPPLKGHTSAVNSVAFSPDRRTLATASGDRAVILWDLSDPARARQSQVPHTSAVSSVAFSPDGSTLATSSFDSGSVTLWDLADPDGPTPREPPLTVSADTVFSVAFSPDGGTLATGDSDGLAVLRDLTDPERPPRSLPGHTGAVNSVAFSPDGRMLATAGDDNTAIVWDLTAMPQPQQLGPALTSHTDRVTAATFASDGRTLATAGDDSTVILWDLTERAPPEPLGPALTSHTGRVTAATFASGGPTILATAGSDGTVILWDLTERAPPRRLGQPLTGQSSPVDSVMFTSDGHALDITSSDGTVTQRDVTDPERPTVGQPRTRSSSLLDSLASAPDGNIMVTASGDGTAILWDITDRTQPRRLEQQLTGHRKLVSAAAFSTDGNTLVTASGDGDAILWNVTDRSEPRRLGQLTGHRKLVTAAAFSTDGNTLATASDDGTVILWDLTDRTQPRPLGKPLTGHTGSVTSVAFAPGRDLLATGGSDATVILWDLTDLDRLRDHATERACAATGRGLDPIEWDRHVSGLPYRDTCALIAAGGDGSR